MITMLYRLRALSTLCVVAALCACGTSAAALAPESGLTALSIDRLAATTMQHYVARPVHPDFGTRWLAKTKPGSHDYFVSDWATDDVYVYKYSQGFLVAKLTGFQEPYGQCADADGNVWIANFEGSSIVEYAHVPTTPIATLSTDGTPIGCAVSPTGELAVANYSTASGPGDIQVFQHESGNADRLFEHDLLQLVAARLRFEGQPLRRGLEQQR